MLFLLLLFFVDGGGDDGDVSGEVVVHLSSCYWIGISYMIDFF